MEDAPKTSAARRSFLHYGRYGRVALLQRSRGNRRLANDAIVVVTVKPQRVLIETTETGQHVNFDFLLENRSDRKLKLTTVELSVFDRRGALARRDFVNLFSRASVAVQGEKLIPPHGSILLFNPMPDFAASVPLHRLEYDFSFTNEDYTGHVESHAEVLPEAYKTRTNLILPLRGRLLIRDGHDLQSHHRRFDYTDAHFRKRGSDTNYQRYVKQGPDNRAPGSVRRFAVSSSSLRAAQRRRSTRCRRSSIWSRTFDVFWERRHSPLNVEP